MNRADSPQTSAAFLSEEKLVFFIEALFRIFKVGIYYPTGHAVLDQSASKCILQLREISPTLESVTIAVGRNALLVEGIKLPETSGAVKDLYLLLEKLGIRTIEIEVSITLKQLLFFVKKLLNWRMQLESTQSFISFDIADLPDSIRLGQQEFFVDEKSIILETPDDDYRQNLNEICIALGEQGLNKQQVEQCRGFLEKLSEPPEGVKTAVKGFPNATWEDVQALLYKIVTGSYSSEKNELDSVANSDINVIASIFESLESNFTDKRSKETIQFLLSHLTGRDSDQPEATQKIVQPRKKMRQLLDDDQKLTVSQLKTFIYENKIPLKVLEQITSVDSSEEMSIILQLVSPDLNEQVNENLEQKLKTILISRLNDRGISVLTGGLIHFSGSGENTYFRYLLSMVLSTLRDSETLNSLEFIVHLWNKIPSTMHVLLWPYVVNELLVLGMGEQEEIFYKATEIASNMHADRMRKLIFQLEEMDAFQEKTVALNVFNPTYIFSYKLFAVLLETSLENIVAEIIYSGLQGKPQDPLFEAVGPLLEMNTSSHCVFIRSYLTQAHLKEPPLALKMAAGQIILNFLQNITEEEKELPWLHKTIAATSSLYVKGIQVMLHKIVKERKMGVIPTWPKNCRIAAETALKSLKRPSLAELL